MKVGKLLKVGDSMGICVPKAYLRQLCWLIGDYLVLEIRGDELVIRNSQQRKVTLINERREYGDGRME